MNTTFENQSYHKWVEYEPHEAHYIKYGIDNPNIISAAYKIKDVYDSFADALALIHYSGLEDYGDLVSDDFSRKFVISLFLKESIAIAARCEDLSLQVINRYFYEYKSGYPLFHEALVDDEILKIDKNVKYHDIIKLLKSRKDNNIRYLLTKMKKFHNKACVRAIRELANQLKHRGTISFLEIGDNQKESFFRLITLNGEEVAFPLLHRGELSFQEVTDIVRNYCKLFLDYFNEIINILIPHDYLKIPNDWDITDKETSDFLQYYSDYRIKKVIK